MKLTPTSALGMIEQCSRRLGELMPLNRHPQDQATLVTQVLHDFGPSAPLVACQVWDGTGHTHIVDHEGQARAAWATALASSFQRQTPTLPLTEEIHLPGHMLLVERRNWKDSAGVVVALAVRQDQAADELILIREFLAVCAGLILPYIVLQVQERLLATCREDLAGEQSTADLGSLAQPLAHEFNNFLNNLVLHLAVLEHQLGESFRPKLVQVRQLGTEIAQLVKRYQQYRQRHAATPQPVDLNVLLRDVLQAAAQPDPRRPEAPTPEVTLDLSPDLPGLMGTTTDVRRCCTFLIANALRAAETGRVRVRTELVNQRLLLHVEDEGPSAAPDDLHHMFELGKKSRPGTEPLELAACQSIVRRLGGRLQAANRPDKGIGITADFPAPSQ